MLLLRFSAANELLNVEAYNDAGARFFLKKTASSSQDRSEQDEQNEQAYTHF